MVKIFKGEMPPAVQGTDLEEKKDPAQVDLSDNESSETEGQDLTQSRSKAELQGRSAENLAQMKKDRTQSTEHKTASEEDPDQRDQ